MQREAAPIVRRQGAATRGACVFARAQVAAMVAAGWPWQAERKVLPDRRVASMGNALTRSRR